MITEKTAIKYALYLRDFCESKEVKDGKCVDCVFYISPLSPCKIRIPDNWSVDFLPDNKNKTLTRSPKE